MGTWSWGDGEGLGVMGGSGVVEGFWGRGDVPGEVMGVWELCSAGQGRTPGLYPASLPQNSKLPSWARAVTPRIFYITEKAWNYYPYTITGETRGRGRPALRGQPCPGLTSPSLPPRCHPVMPACRGGPAEYTVRARGGPVPFQSCGWGEGAGVGVPRGPAPRRSPRSAPSCPSSPSTSRPNTRTTAGTART